VIPNDPVSSVRWVPIEWVVANDYNPNSVARNEMNLLYISIKHDGYTQPIVTVIDYSCVIHFPCRHKLTVKDGAHPVWKLVKPLNDSPDRTTTVKGIKCPKCKRTPARMQVEDASCAVIVDGFHRYQVCKAHKDISGPRGNQVPIVIINKSINERMASRFGITVLEDATPQWAWRAWCSRCWRRAGPTRKFATRSAWSRRNCYGSNTSRDSRNCLKTPAIRMHGRRSAWYVCVSSTATDRLSEWWGLGLDGFQVRSVKDGPDNPIAIIIHD
jgi:hypothetical protein